ncbi:MAG: hypothetical protein AAFO58_06910, partial [Pseudomonadota bacterium]
MGPLSPRAAANASVLGSHFIVLVMVTGVALARGPKLTAPPVTDKNRLSFSTDCSSHAGASPRGIITQQNIRNVGGRLARKIRLCAIDFRPILLEVPHCDIQLRAT